MNSGHTQLFSRLSHLPPFTPVKLWRSLDGSPPLFSTTAVRGLFYLAPLNNAPQQARNAPAHGRAHIFARAWADRSRAAQFSLPLNGVSLRRSSKTRHTTAATPRTCRASPLRVLAIFWHIFQLGGSDGNLCSGVWISSSGSSLSRALPRRFT